MDLKGRGGETMKRWIVCGLLVLVACNKPSEESCLQAIENMQKILGSEGGATDIKQQIRRCKGGSSKKAVECAIAAKTRADLLACEFTKFDDKPADSGSAQ